MAEYTAGKPFTRLAPGRLGAMRSADAFGFTRIDDEDEAEAGGGRHEAEPHPQANANGNGDGSSGSNDATATRNSVALPIRPADSRLTMFPSREKLKGLLNSSNDAATNLYEPEELRKAATRIQRWYRGVCAMYAAFGPMMFSCKDGRMADFGSVSYLSGTREAKFIRISDTTSVGALAHFLEKYWRLPRPDVLLSVTGSAATLQLTSALQRTFDRGLATAAAMTNAWIFTGGTDSGVMKLVGDAIHKYGLEVPLVGIAPWGAVMNRRLMHGCKGETVQYRGGAPGPLEGRLNPHHTHQILVDAAREYGEGAVAWGHEIGMRSQLERVYAQAKAVPVVLLVVQGGPNTLDLMLASAKEGSPLLVLSDSGGAATALWQHCESGAGGVTDPLFVDLVDKLEALRSLDESRENSLITFFRLADDDAEETMSTALLSCLFHNLMYYQHSIHGDLSNRTAEPLSNRVSRISRATSSFSSITGVVRKAKEAVRGRRDHMQRALLLAVRWNSVASARRMLAELPGTEDYSRPLDKMLQHALELQRVEIAALLLDRPGCSVKNLSLNQLYLQEDPYNFLRSDLSLQARLQRRLSDGTIARSVQPKDMYAVYKEIVGPFLRSLSPLVSAAIDNNTQAGHVDLFFWAVIMGNVGLARELWALVDNPLHCALLASHVCMRMLERITWGLQDVEASKTAYESWAVGVMDQVDEQEIAHLILAHNVEVWRMGALVEIALQMEVKSFLAHRHCRSLMDVWWRGRYPGSGCELQADDSYVTNLRQILLPCFNPHLSKKSASLAQRAPRSREEREQVLFGALAQALSNSQKARRAASSSTSMSVLRKNPTRRLPNAKEGSRILLGGAGGGGGDAGAGSLAEGSVSRLDASGLGHTRVHFTVERESDPHGRTTTAIGSIERSKSTKSLVKQPSHRFAMRLEAARVQMSQSHSVVRALGDFYGVPLIKYLMRATVHVAFLALYTLVLTHLVTANQLQDMAPRIPPLTEWEVLFVVWALSLAYDHRRRQVQLQVFGMNKSRLPFQSIVSLGHLALVLAILVRGLSRLPAVVELPAEALDVDGPAYLVTSMAYVIYTTILSLNAVLMYVEIFTFMWTSESFGVLAIIMGQMLVDLSLFLVFAVVFVFGFSAALLGLSETAVADGSVGEDTSIGGRLLRGAGGPDDYTGLPLVAVPVWAMFTDLELGPLMSIPFALPLMLAFVLLANVVLVNLLIAMFADTYSRIKQNAEVEYQYQRFLHIFEHIHVVPTIPPPFSAPWLLLVGIVDLLGNLLSLAVGTSAAEPTASAADELHRVAAARPVLGQRTQGPVSKQYVQRFLKEDTDTSTPGGMLRKVESLMGSLDDRVGQHLERLDVQLGARGSGPQSEEETRATMARLLALMQRTGDLSTLPRLGQTGARPAGFFGAMLGGTSASAAAANRPAGISRPADSPAKGPGNFSY